MKLFYVMGGGLGHLCRVQMFIHQWNVVDFQILTNNPLAVHVYSPERIIQIAGATKEEVAEHIVSVLAEVVYDELYVDAFPAGLFGELIFTKEKKYHYLARRLKWYDYEILTKDKSIYFEQTFCFEELEREHELFISQVCSDIRFIKPAYPEPRPENIPKEIMPSRRPLWLIVHAFEIEEIESLVNYATALASLENLTPAIVVLTDRQVDLKETDSHFYFPAQDWFPVADRIFTGGGFNAMYQTARYFHKTTSIPFPRKYDDQFWRVSEFKKNFGLPSARPLK